MSVCENCGTPDPREEVDCPQHCDDCGRPLDYSLTADGIEYVLETLRYALENGIDDHIIPLKGTAEEDCLSYYHGSPHYEITRDWASDLSYYGGLSEEAEATIEQYLAACEQLENARA